MPSATHDLSPLIPVLESGTEVPGFAACCGDGGWWWRGKGVLWDRVQGAPPEAYYAAIGWLTDWLSSNHCRVSLNAMGVVVKDDRRNMIGNSPSVLLGLVHAWRHCNDC